jgi:DNA-binding SARP family transcriptional activator
MLEESGDEDEWRSQLFSPARFELLGPVRGWQDGTELALGSPQQRGVLAMLLLARGRQVPLSGLIDGLWDGEVPRSATGTVRTYVSRLRSLLKTALDNRADEPVEYIGDGYRLELGTAVLDVELFERGLREARAARQADQLGRASRLLHDVLALWRGDALAGVPGPFADAQRVRLTELRMVATEEKLAVDISVGEHAVAISHLRQMLAEHPFREALSELLMLALYKSGRQADALGVFGVMRERLRDELGVDPGPALQLMHQRILRADDRLLNLTDMYTARRPVTGLAGASARLRPVAQVTLARTCRPHSVSVLRGKMSP